MSRRSLSFWLFASALWLPFLCLFAPFTFMREAYDPWYIGYTSVLHIVALLFYLPANKLSQLISGGGVHLILFRTLAFSQSVLLSWILWRRYHSGRRSSSARPSVEQQT